MLADLFTKNLQGALFAKLCEVIMVWNHIYTLNMVPLSTKESLENLYKINPCTNPRKTIGGDNFIRGYSHH